MEKPNLEKITEDGFRETKTFIAGYQVYSKGSERIIYDKKNDSIIKQYVFVEPIRK